MPPRKKPEWIEKIEVELRGKYLQIAIDAEWMLLMIIDQCFQNNRDEVKTFFRYKNGRQKKLSDLSFDERIEVCKRGLQKYYPNVYASHSKVFHTINRLRKTRNIFAHSKIDTVHFGRYNPADKTHITIHTLHKNFTVKSEPTKIVNLRRRLNRYHKSLTTALIMLTKVLHVKPLVIP